MPRSKKTKALPEEGEGKRQSKEGTLKIPKIEVPVKCEDIGETFFIKSILDSYVEDWKRAHPGDKMSREYFYMSDIGKCPRSLFYQFKNPDKKADISVSTIMMFSFGEMFHDAIQQRMKGLGYTTNKNIEFGAMKNVHFLRRGRLDLLIFEGEDGSMTVAEIKSKTPFAFDSDPDPSEMDQMMSYVESCLIDPFFKTRNVKINPWGYLIYVDRAGLSKPSMKAWKVYLDEERLEQIERWFVAVDACIKAGECPERPYIRESTNCSYCRFRAWCWRDVPEPEEPRHEKDEAVTPPAMEIVESSADALIRLDEQIKALEKEYEIAERVMVQHFKGTGQSELPREGGFKIQFLVSQRTILDESFLWKKCKAFYNKIARPQMGLMKAAVDEGIVSGTTFEKAKTYVRTESVRIVRPKKDKKSAE